jgi:hypothetical protein
LFKNIDTKETPMSTEFEVTVTVSTLDPMTREQVEDVVFALFRKSIDLDAGQVDVVDL